MSCRQLAEDHQFLRGIGFVKRQNEVAFQNQLANSVLIKLKRRQPGSAAKVGQPVISVIVIHDSAGGLTGEVIGRGPFRNANPGLSRPVRVFGPTPPLEKPATLEIKWRWQAEVSTGFLGILLKFRRQ